MTLTSILAWLDAHWLAIGAVLGALVGVWKAIPAAQREAFERSNPRLVGAVRTVVRLAPDVIGAYRTVKYQVIGGEPRPAAAPTVPPRVIAPSLTQTMRAVDPESSGSSLRGFAKLDALAWALGVGVLCASAALLAGCPLPAPDGCTPRDTRCSPAGIPEVCSASQRWTHGATTPACSSWGASITCCLARTPYDGVRHACVPPVACLPETPSAAPDAGAEGGAL